jgi:hypothetical protein
MTLDPIGDGVAGLTAGPADINRLFSMVSIMTAPLPFARFIPKSSDMNRSRGKSDRDELMRPVALHLTWDVG